ncbi:hypothetical protein B4100_0312 [Heyndrickxia coagulans]|uniref:Uncharacterized protein n=1 Tax=Heyndrickxia coagulans TaxID=1398 RepID=A0A150K101_HEYCO|nr:hypothetical protein B4099_0448 [Heyndrickxia coagulans]KYC63152.1 hypothetical protein B4100_0312 [Heyndrickxia coagulans]
MPLGCLLKNCIIMQIGLYHLNIEKKRRDTTSRRFFTDLGLFLQPGVPDVI